MTMIPNTLPQDAQTELQLSRLYLLQDLLNVMQQNLDVQLLGQPGITISQNGGNVFALASKYYNDATLWTEIANINQTTLMDANGFINPNISTLISIVIPPKPATTSGGIFVV